MKKLVLFYYLLGHVFAQDMTPHQDESSHVKGEMTAYEKQVHFTAVVNCVLMCESQIKFNDFWNLTGAVNYVLTSYLDELKRNIRRKDDQNMQRNIERLKSYQKDLEILAAECFTNRDYLGKSDSVLPLLKPEQHRTVLASSSGMRLEQETSRGSTYSRTKYSSSGSTLKPGQTTSFKLTGRPSPQKGWVFQGEAILENSRVEVPSSDGKGISETSLGGLSGLTYDPKSKLFYAVADNTSGSIKPSIYKFSLQQERNGKFSWQYKGALRLSSNEKDCYDRRVRRGWSFSTERYCSTDGIYNINFESIALHPTDGFLLTSEAPFGQRDDVSQRVRHFNAQAAYQSDIKVDSKYQFEEERKRVVTTIPLADVGSYSTQGKPDNLYEGKYISQFPDIIKNGRTYTKRLEKKCKFWTPDDCWYEVRYISSARKIIEPDKERDGRFTLTESGKFWTQGVDPNQGFEGGTTTPNGNYYIASEGPLAGDSVRTSRIIEHTQTDGTYSVAQEFIYPRDEGTGGYYYEVSDIFAESDTSFLVLERYYNKSAKTAYARVYRTSIQEAKPIAGTPAVLEKELVLDLNNLTRHLPKTQKLDNYEGLALGPPSKNGKPTLVLISDDNYSGSQRTSVLLFKQE